MPRPKKDVPTVKPVIPSLEEVELEVEAEGREWMRQRLQERLQQLADEHGEVFPPKRPTDPEPPASSQNTA